MSDVLLKEALLKAANYCAYQERTQREVRQRLRDWGLLPDEAEGVIAELIIEGFLNEERYAKTYAGGKFRVKEWGRQKIAYELKLKGLSARNIQTGLAEIDDETYQATLSELLRKKAATLRKDSPLVRKQKLARFAIGKGYEPDLVWDLLANFAS
jgi:regulatory protein